MLNYRIRRIGFSAAALLTFPSTCSKRFQFKFESSMSTSSESTSTHTIERNVLEDFLLRNIVNAKTVPHTDIPKNPLIVKSLVWTYMKVNPVLVVLPLEWSVDKTKLAQYLRVSGPKHMRMATPELVVEVTGQTVGNVSPIGHKQHVRTIVDEALVKKYGINMTSDLDTSDDIICYGGGGATGRELMIGLKELLRISKAEVADISTLPKLDSAKAECAAADSAQIDSSTCCAALSTSSKDMASCISVDNVDDCAAKVSESDVCTSNSNKQHKPINKRFKMDLQSGKEVRPVQVISTASLAKSLRDAAIDRINGLKQLEQLISKHTTVNNATLKDALNMGTAGSGKTPLHLAAWKGDIESVKLLLRHGVNIDTYSTGPGNYGKTAIFYAITQCRDDVVALLLQHGANVRIVNNKGQTPLSLAVSHLAEETINLIQDAENAQIAVKWQDFYTSHYSDRNTCFGDLDPRFHELGREIRAEKDVHHKGVDGGLPRSINETTFEFRRNHYLSYSKSEHMLDDLLVSVLGNSNRAADATCGGAAVSGDKSMSGFNSITLSEGLHTSVVKLNSVVGRVALVEKHPECGFIIVTLVPPYDTQGDVSSSLNTYTYWDVQWDSKIRSSTLPETKNNSQIKSVKRMSLRIEGVSTKPDVPKSREVLQCIGADLRVGQVIYANGTLLGEYSGGDSLTVEVDKIAIFGRSDFTKSESSSQRDGRIKNKAWNDHAHELNHSSIIPSIVSPIADHVTLSDIASSFELNQQQLSDLDERHSELNIPILVVDDLRTIEIFSQDIGAMIEEIQKSGADKHASSSAGEVADCLRLRHVVGMDCEWRPGEIFVPRAGAGAGAGAGPSPAVRRETATTTSAISAPAKEHAAQHAEVTLTTATPTDISAIPLITKTPDYPVAVLQLATRRRAYLIDLQEIIGGVDLSLNSVFNSETKEANQADDVRVQTISRLNKCLEDLFLNPTIVKLGFKAAPDFERLACSFPALPCFRRIISVLDTCTLAQLSIPELIKSKQLPSSVMQGQSLKQLGLSRLCSLVLDGKGLDKTQQCSGWHLRPLTLEQMRYAALDAATLLFILDFFTAKTFPSFTQELTIHHILQNKLFRAVIFNVKFNIFPLPSTESVQNVFPENCTDRVISLSKDKASKRSAKGNGKRITLDVEVATQQWLVNQHEPDDYSPLTTVPQSFEEDVSVGEEQQQQATGGRLVDRYKISASVTSLLGNMQLAHDVHNIDESLSDGDRHYHHHENQRHHHDQHDHHENQRHHHDHHDQHDHHNYYHDSTYFNSSVRKGYSQQQDWGSYLGEYISQHKETCASFVQALINAQHHHSHHPTTHKPGNNHYIRILSKKQGNLAIVGDNLLLFINCPSAKFSKNPRNGTDSRFLDKGRYVTWFTEAAQIVRENSTRVGKIRSFLLDGIVNHYTTTPQLLNNKNILLFIRQNAAPYVFCGRSTAVALYGEKITASATTVVTTTSNDERSFVKVVLQLKDYDDIVSTNNGMSKDKGKTGIHNSFYLEMIENNVISK